MTLLGCPVEICRCIACWGPLSAPIMYIMLSRAESGWPRRPVGVPCPVFHDLQALRRRLPSMRPPSRPAHRNLRVRETWDASGSLSPSSSNETGHLIYKCPKHQELKSFQCPSETTS